MVAAVVEAGPLAAALLPVVQELQAHLYKAMLVAAIVEILRRRTQPVAVVEPVVLVTTPREARPAEQEELVYHLLYQVLQQPMQVEAVVLYIVAEPVAREVAELVVQDRVRVVVMVLPELCIPEVVEVEVAPEALVAPAVRVL